MTRIQPDEINRSCINSYSSSDTSYPISGVFEESTINNRLEQMIQDVYIKTTQTILQSRVSHYELNTKENDWLNIIFDCFKEEPSGLKDLVINIYLETTLDSKLVSDRILIESWSLKLDHSQPIPPDPVDFDLYKKFISFFRSLHSLVRLLPSHDLYKRLKKHGNGTLMTYTLSKVLLSEPFRDSVNTYEFTDIKTPLGVIKLNTIYLEHLPVLAIQQESPRPTCSSSTKSRTGFQYLSTRRVSNPIISPFKSPSLSASPQQELARRLKTIKIC
ncbi:unnamed protein product [Rhizopus stolonifer]